jgi:hypothetical protein
MGSMANTSFDLAEVCDALADQIDARGRLANFQESDGEEATLEHLASCLEDAADNLRTAGVAASLESATSAIAAIGQATVQAKSVLANLKKATEMITLAGSLLSLAAAAASGNLGTIGTSAVAVLSEAKQLLSATKGAGSA